MKKVYVLLADGFETIEALTPIDVLRRCGLDVITVSISDSDVVTSSHKVPVLADSIISEIDLSDGEMVILPGGYPGFVNLGNSEEVGDIVKEYFAEGKYVAAICAAPTVLVKNGVGKGYKVTCHSSVVDQMTGVNYIGGDVVADRNIITAIGAGRSLDFALCLAEHLVDEETLNRVKRGLEIL